MNQNDQNQNKSLARQSPDFLEVLMSMFIQAASAIQSAAGDAVIGTILGVLGAGALTLHQNENQKKFEHYCKQALSRLDATKIDAEFLQSSQFKDILIQVGEAAQKTSSDAKMNAFANILCGCFTKPTSAYINKEGMIRIVINMSEEEMKALYEIRKAEQKFFNQPDTRKSTIPGGIVKDVAHSLGWSAEDALIACYGLEQLNLITDPTFDGGLGFDDSHELIPGEKLFRSTSLAARVILLASGGNYQANSSDAW